MDDFRTNKNPYGQPPSPANNPAQPPSDDLPPFIPIEEHSPLTRKPPPIRPFERKTSTQERARNIISTIILLISAPLIALLLTAFVFQSYQVDGPSMEPTLNHNDRLIVLKLGHTWSRITDNPYIPERGEIIVFVRRGTPDAGTNHDKQLIKRVVGLPGDRVVIRDGVLTVYNQEHPNGFRPDEEFGYETAGYETPGTVDVRVEVGHVFVVGDNRINSLDSRAFGTVASEDIVGQLILRILPLSKAKTY